MREISFEKLKEGARSCKLERYHQGIFPSSKIRRKPRDPEALAALAAAARRKFERYPWRFEDGILVLPSVTFTPEEIERARAWVASLDEIAKA